MTNYGNIGRLTALILGALFYISPASAQGTGASSVVFIQAAGWNTNTVNQMMPVLRSPVDTSAQAGATNDVWLKLFQYQPVTKYVEPMIQSDLSHGVKFTYKMTFNLGARNNTRHAISVPDGWYQMQIAVIRLGREDIYNPNNTQENPLSRYVTSVSEIVEITGGGFTKDVTLRFPQVTDIALKHHLYVELIPLDNNCTFEPYSGASYPVPCIRTKPNGEANPTASTLKPLPRFRNYLLEMPFVPKITYGSTPSETPNQIDPRTLPFQRSLADYIAEAQLFLGQQRAKNKVNPLTPDQYAAQAKLYYIKTSDPFFDRVGQRWQEGNTTWKQMFESILRQRSSGAIHIPAEYASMFSMLCEAMISTNHKYQEDMRQPMLFFAPYGDVNMFTSLCRMMPEKRFRITRVIHIGKALGAQYKRINQNNYNYNIMSNFALNRSTSQDTFQSYSFKPASILFNFISSLGLSMGFIDIGVTNSIGNSRSTSGTGIASMGLTLDFSYYNLNIPTLNSTACLEIRPVARGGDPTYDPTPGAKNGFYVCDDTQKNLDIPETFAHVFVRCGDSGIIDCYDPLSQDMNFALRGDREISGFLYAVRKMISPSGENQLQPFADTAGAEDFFRLTAVTGQMRYITPIEFPTEAVPSFMGRLLYMYGEKFDQQFAQQ